jgi:hypothetical protein
MSRVTCFEGSRRAWIPSPPDEPPVLVLWLNQVTPTVLWWTAVNPADSVQPLRQSYSWLGCHVVPAFVAKPTNCRARLCRATEEPDSFLVNSRKPRMKVSASPRQAFHLRLPDGLLSLAPFNDLAATLYRLHLGFEAQPRNRTRLRLAFLATMRPALDLVRPPGPSSRAYSSLQSSEAPQG